MGSGKTTLAPIVANILGYTSLDLDTEIERTIGTSIAEYFKTEGEEKFRAIEQQTLIATQEHAHVVVALGGGTVTYGENIKIIKSAGLLVYLKSDVATIIKRVKRKQNRPLLHDENGVTLPEQELQERIKTLLERRAAYYTQADIIIDVSAQTLPFTADKLANKIRRYIET